MLRMRRVCLLVGTGSGCSIRTVRTTDLPLGAVTDEVKALTIKDLLIK